MCINPITSNNINKGDIMFKKKIKVTEKNIDNSMEYLSNLYIFGLEEGIDELDKNHLLLAIYALNELRK
jgi:hypothetical protein